MPNLLVDGLRFDFRPSMTAKKYDESQHYQDLLKPKGKKAVDLVAMRRQAIPVTLWLIEAKNFRVISSPPDRSNISGLAQTVADKVADSLLGLEDAAKRRV